MTTRCCVARFIRTLSTVISTIVFLTLSFVPMSVENLMPLLYTYPSTRRKSLLEVILPQQYVPPCLCTGTVSLFSKVYQIEVVIPRPSIYGNRNGAKKNSENSFDKRLVLTGLLWYDCLE